jgi:hypothetical protein
MKRANNKIPEIFLIVAIVCDFCHSAGHTIISCQAENISKEKVIQSSKQEKKKKRRDSTNMLKKSID